MCNVRVPTSPPNPDPNPRPTLPLPRPQPPRPAAEELEQVLAGMAPADPITEQGINELAELLMREEAEAALDSHFYKTMPCPGCGGHGFMPSGSWCRTCGGARVVPVEGGAP
jgi:hypothetical protein